jgi:hypothetical protein
MAGLPELRSLNMAQCGKTRGADRFQEGTICPF